MEKCTFCVQRIRRARHGAEESERDLQDGDIQPACVQSCPADAMVFGDLEDEASRVSKRARSRRAFHSMEELGTKPSVVYLKEDEWSEE